MSLTTEKTVAAAHEMAQRCFEAFVDHATAFGCGEIEAIAEVYRVLEHEDQALMIVKHHATGDDAGDLHELVGYEAGSGLHAVDCDLRYREVV